MGEAQIIWAVLGFSNFRGRQSSSHFGKKTKHKTLSSLSVPRSDASAGAPPRLGELWVTDPTPDSLRLSWTVPEGHFDSFVVQFKDRDGPQVLPVEGHERSVTVAPLDAGRKYRFLLYGLLGKRRHGPLTGEGTTGEARPSRGISAGTPHPLDGSRVVLCGGCPRGCCLAPADLAGIQPHLLTRAQRTSPAGRRPGTALTLTSWAFPSGSPRLPETIHHFFSVSPSQRLGGLWMRLEQNVPQNPVWGRSWR